MKSPNVRSSWSILCIDEWGAVTLKPIPSSFFALAAVAASKQTLSSAVLLVGLALNGMSGWSYADPIAALVIAGIAVPEGIDTWRGDGCCADQRARPADRNTALILIVYCGRSRWPEFGKPWRRNLGGNVLEKTIHRAGTVISGSVIYVQLPGHTIRRIPRSNKIDFRACAKRGNERA